MPQSHLIDRFINCMEEVRQLDLLAIARVLERATRIFTAGNGGSSATASHFAADLARIGLPAICLSDNISAITSFANDLSFDKIYAKQLDIIHKEDALVVLSVSGESVNLIKAIGVANSKEASTIALVGSGGGSIGHLAKHSLILSSDRFGEIEGIHSCICHMLPVIIQEERGGASQNQNLG